MVLLTSPSIFAVVSLALRVWADPNMTPNYEIHLDMDPTKVLGSDFKLTPTVLSTFGMPTTVTKMNVQYLDTDSEDLYNNHWDARIRNMEGSSDFDLTYKFRLPIGNGDINAALTQANTDGFDAGDTGYDAQVEWGYTSETLSISREHSASESGYSGMDLPSKKDSRKMLIDNAPDKFNDWLYNDWGTTMLGSARIYGPVLAKRSIGTWNSTQLYIEVWPIKNVYGNGTDYIVEASFKVDTFTEASDKKAALQAYLINKNWFLAVDQLKTSLIMQRY